MLVAVSAWLEEPPPVEPLGPAGAASFEPPNAHPPTDRPPTTRERLDAAYLEHHEAIWRTVRRLGVSPEVAADATQQAYLIAAERVETIFLGSEKAFLYSTALRSARGIERKNRSAELVEEPDAIHNALGGPSGDVTTRHAAADFLGRLLGRMDPALVAIFVLYELEGFSSPEIAEIVGVPLGTVASRLRRARAKFKRAALALEQVKTRPELEDAALERALAEEPGGDPVDDAHAAEGGSHISEHRSATRNAVLSPDSSSSDSSGSDSSSSVPTGGAGKGSARKDEVVS